jgi:hypothetical protein
MARTRPFAYNPSQNPIQGVDIYGDLAIGRDSLDYSVDPGGIKWWMGPDEDTGYIIGGVASGGTQPSPLGDIGTVGFWKTESSTQEQFILLASQLSGHYFSNTSDAITWLNGNGFWTSYDPLLVTLTPTPSVTPMGTPSVTVTPTVTPTPSRAVSGPLLDDYSGATVAYSLRKLRTAYSGSAIRVRRSSDNTEQDIGFLNNGLDTTALTTFVGSNNGFVTAWYDQSGNGNNAVQSTSSRQPRIVTNGSIEYQGSRPVMKFVTGATASLTSTSAVPTNVSHISSFIVAGIYPSPATTKSVVSIGGHYFSYNYSITMGQYGPYQTWGGDDATAWGKGFYMNSSNGPQIVIDRTLSYFPNVKLLTSVVLGTSDTGYYINGVSKTAKTLYNGTFDPFNVNAGVTIGSLGTNATDSFDGFVSEVVMYKSNKTSDRGSIENNINGYHIIY